MLPVLYIVRAVTVSVSVGSGRGMKSDRLFMGAVGSRGDARQVEGGDGGARSVEGGKLGGAWPLCCTPAGVFDCLSVVLGLIVGACCRSAVNRAMGRATNNRSQFCCEYTQNTRSCRRREEFYCCLFYCFIPFLFF